MNANEYQQQAMRTAASGCKDLNNAGMGLASEAGEIAKCIRKAMFHGEDLDETRVFTKLGDLLWYAALTAELIGSNLGEVMYANIMKLRVRYPDGYPEKNKPGDDSSLKAFIEQEVPYRLENMGLPDDQITDDLVRECVNRLYESNDIMFDYDKIDDFLLDIVDKYSGKGDGEHDDCRSTV